MLGDVSYVYCFKSVGSYIHKLTRIEIRILSDPLLENKLYTGKFSIGRP